MKYKINTAVVIGSGTMGAAIAAHLANAGVSVSLLDIVPNKLTAGEEQKGLKLTDREVHNRIVQEGLDRALKSRPASFFTPEVAARLRIGNLEDDFGVVEEADWVIEAIIENLEIKRSLMERIDAARAPYTIISTNTSGIPVASIAEGRSESFRKHFLGTHFFNPPRYLKLLEIIPMPDTLPEVLELICRFGEYRLGKGIVLAKDTPNFIANRLFSGSSSFLTDYVLKNDYTVEEVDAITGSPIGNPKTATFRLFDLVGLDVWEHVGKNLAPAIPHDEHALRYMRSEQVIALIRTMNERGWLGTKTKQGFYKEVRLPDGSKEFYVLNLKTLEYEPPSKVRFDSIGKVKDEPDLDKRLKILVAADDRAGQLVRALTFQSFAYASERIPEIADTPKPIDDSMRWGFNREAGPFETWDMLGVAEIIPAMTAAGFPPHPWVQEMLDKGCPTFYQYADGCRTGVYNPVLGNYQTIQWPPTMIVLKDLKSTGKLVQRNPGASLIDLGDGVLCLEFHTKVNALDDDILNMMQIGLDLVEKDYEGMVIGNEADDFCSGGANVFMVALAAQNAMWELLDASVKKLQDINMRMRYFPKPVVVAPFGRVFGGGAEITMHGSRVVSDTELYTGQTEIVLGLIPAGGGTKELLRRILNPPMRTKNTEVLPFLQRIFEQIGLAKVSMSAEEARQMGFLNPCDRVVMGREHLLAEAKREVVHMVASGYQPPLPEKIYAAGRDSLGALRVGIYMMKEGGYITEYESHIANKLSYVMTGGELSSPIWVSEQYILDLEREAFLSLCGEQKTQERIWHMLQTGKPLRN